MEESSGSTVTYDVPAGSFRTVYVAVLNSPAPAQPIRLDRSAYESARWDLVRYWDRRLGEGSTIDVPEERVRDAYRSLLIQNLALTWRYSVGNPYQQFSFPEGIDVAQVMSAQGFSTVARAILLKSFTTPVTRYPNWKMGQKLVGSALYYRLYRDRSYIEQVTPALRAYMTSLGDQIEADPRGMLGRERFSSDIKDSVYGLHSQAIVWQGLRTMASVWAETGEPTLAAEARTLAARLEKGLRSAIRASQRRLPDGSLFIPARLLDPEKPYGSVTESHSGGYWNLVAPYAFASGLFAPESAEARRRHPLPAPPRIALSRSRTRRRVLAVRHRRRVPELWRQPGLWPERRTLPRRQRPVRPARAQPLWATRSRDGTWDVRLRGGALRRSAGR